MGKLVFSADPRANQAFIDKYKPRYRFAYSDIVGARGEFKLANGLFIAHGFGYIDGFAALVGRYRIELPDGIRFTSTEGELEWYKKQNERGPLVSMPHDAWYFGVIACAVNTACYVLGSQRPRMLAWQVINRIFHMSGPIGADYIEPNQLFMYSVWRDCLYFRLPGSDQNLDLDFSGDIFNALMSVYYGMIAESCKKKPVEAILGPRVKILGLYKILFENAGIETASLCMNGVNHKALAREMESIGIGYPDPKLLACDYSLKSGEKAFVESFMSRCWDESVRRGISPGLNEANRHGMF